MSQFAAETLTCVRGGRAVFARLSFALESGQALFLLGPNGSGKSSLLRLLAGLLRPCAGKLIWDGQPVQEDPEAHGARLHYVGHHDAVKPVLTVSETLHFWARLHGGDSENRVLQAMERFAITRLADVPGRLLSAGQKRRVNLARLIAAPAPLWLLDEPSVALDKASVKALEDAMAQHRAEGGMVIVSTHADIDLPDAAILRLDDFAAPSQEAA
ncbi:heme exporter subunit; ATP-binding component of ABC superfamily [Rhodospirillaceae bacterium LM-1]|nr:heme exporter subunit; ATP-binding component of ABC superfamily [Rhodospirillaceae bacterium LM-1]